MKRSPVRYDALAQWFHWVTAIVVFVAFICGPGGSETRVYSSAVDFDRQLHETLGLAVFMIVLLRLLWRRVDAGPSFAATPRWMERASKIVQGLVYVMMLALPVTAMTGAWLEGHPLTLLGGLHIGPALSLRDGVLVSMMPQWLPLRRPVR